MIISIIIGLMVGIFLLVGSAVLLKRALAIMNSTKGSKWSMGEAIGLASLWTGKIIAAGLVLFFAHNAGYSVLIMGLMMPVGIIVGVLVLKATKSNF
jgi:hypothetical protein